MCTVPTEVVFGSLEDATTEAPKRQKKPRVYKKNSNHQQRIVNGYKAKNRPWLALIVVEGGTCGGALINKK